jgi:predicted DNA-binding protein (UPF0251 family)
MKRLWTVGLVVVAVAASGGAAQQARRTYTYNPRGYRYSRQQTAELTIEEQRKLGLSDEQILKIAQQRREVEAEREKVEKQLEEARAAAAAANAQVAQLNAELRTLSITRLRRIYESVMTPEQLKSWKKQQNLDQARQFLRSYMRWLNLTDAQVEDIAQLLLPVYEKYDRLEDELEAAKERLAELRKAEKIDIEAIAEAEEQVAELSKTNLYQARYKELREAMRPGLMPDQLEKFDRYGRR